MSELENIAEEVVDGLESQDDLALVKKMQDGRDQIIAEIKKVIVGQEAVIDELLIALFAGGHCLITGVPGLAKTLLIKTVADILQVDFSRIQFTPDLLPSDITGTEIFRPEDGSFRFQPGPIIHNLVLADEINRAPAKVQSALLEVMQEKQVTIGEESFKLAPPFFVMATQNPVEQECVYQLPEAQLDRFMMKLVVGYNTKEEELEIARRIANKTNETVNAVISLAELEDT